VRGATLDFSGVGLQPSLGGVGYADLGRALLSGGSMDLSALQLSRGVNFSVNWSMLVTNVTAARRDSENQAIKDLATA
jgi:hypothetical protein